MARKIIAGVMGGSKPDVRAEMVAYDLGQRIAEKGWILLNGGRNTGVMDASAKGASKAGGIVIGILPDPGPGKESQYLDICIYTGMYHARNLINVLSSHVVFACPGEAGTLSEIALALGNQKKVLAVAWDPGSSFDDYKRLGLLEVAATPKEAIEKAEAYLRP